MAVAAFASTAWAGPCIKCKIVPVNMSVSLAVGTLRTPEFLVKHADYKILVRVRRGLPLGQLQCMMGVRMPWERDPCPMLHLDTALEAEWRVWDGDHIVTQGSVHGRDDRMAVSDETLDRYLGTFVGESNKKYILKVKFTKDGTPLNEFKPRLMVQIY
jgi:hypothetical protein